MSKIIGPKIKEVELEFCKLIKNDNSYVVLRIRNKTRRQIRLFIEELNFDFLPHVNLSENLKNELLEKVTLNLSGLPSYEVTARGKEIVSTNEITNGMLLIKNPCFYNNTEGIEELLSLTIVYSVEFLSEGERINEIAATQVFTPFRNPEGKFVKNEKPME